MALAQSERIAALHTPLAADELAIKSLVTTEGMGRMPTFEIEAVSQSGDLSADSLMGQAVCVEIECLLGPVNQDGAGGKGKDEQDQEDEDDEGGSGGGSGGDDVDPDVASFQETFGKIDADVMSPSGPGASATRAKGGKTGSRYFHGHVIRFAPLPRHRRYFHYRLTVAPWLWFLTRTSNCRIFQKKSVPDILKSVFQTAGFQDAEWRLSGQHPPREYCVQYRETDFNFVSRLLEEEGISYFFTHTRRKHTLVLADSPDAHREFPGYAEIKFSGRNESRNTSEERIFEWLSQHRHHTGAYAHTDYDFTKPKAALLTRDAMPPEAAQANLEVYDYPGNYTVYGSGEDLARVRMQELHVEGLTYHGHGDARGLASGFCFELTEPAIPSDGGRYLVLSNSINLQANVYETDDLAGGAVYQCAFVATKADEVFRPPRLTPKPLIHGVQTAIVTGPAGEEIHTDQYGRVKVQFYWDREGKHDENTTCFIRVGQVWAGKRWGATFIPRIGQEVIVAFLEGDPDQPIIVGSVYNGDQMFPYLGGGPDGKHANDPKVSGIKTLSTKGGAGYNELRFDDNKGKEQVFLHGEKNLDIRVKNDAMENIDNCRHLTVGASQHELVTKDKHLKVKGYQEEAIDGYEKRHVVGKVDEALDADHKQLIGGADHLHVKGDRKQKIDGATSLTIGTSQQEKVGTKHAVDAGQEIHLKAGMKVVIEAGVQLTIKVGGNHVTLDPSGVTIVGTMVKINSGGAAASGGGSSPASPEDAAVGRPGRANGGGRIQNRLRFRLRRLFRPAPPAQEAPGRRAGGGGGKGGGGSGGEGGSYGGGR